MNLLTDGYAIICPIADLINGWIGQGLYKVLVLSHQNLVHCQIESLTVLKMP